jgi:hypothetical protein
MDRILTVTTPPISTNLTTTTRVKLELGITKKADDALISIFVAGASSAAVGYCMRDFAQATYAEQIRSYPFIDSASLVNLPDYIYLSRKPLVSIASIIEDGVTLVAGTDYEFDPEKARLTRLCSDRPVTWRFRKLNVAYVAGYTYPGTLPAAVESGVTEIVKDMWFAKRRDPQIKSYEVPGIERTDYWVGAVGGDSAWPPRVTDFLAPYVDERF